jgi:hypothetical protein
MTLHAKWYPARIRNGLDKEEEREKFERMVRGGTSCLKRLREIILEDVKAIESTKSFDDYDSPGWSMKHADRLGQLRVLKKLLTLMEFIDDRQ